MSTLTAKEVWESLKSKIKEEGRGRPGYKYLLNQSFTLDRSSSYNDLPLMEEAKIDFDWSWEVANGESPDPPSGSYIVKRFGGTHPYGKYWKLRSLLEKLGNQDAHRQLVLYNGEEACVTNFQFWPRVYQNGLLYLDLFVSLRSSDVGEMLPFDMQYSKHLLDSVCFLTSYLPGEVNFHIVNAHVYK